MEWWIWFIAALVFFGLELFISLAFFFFFVALSFLLVGILSLTGIVTDLATQLVLSGLFSIGIGLFLRPVLKGRELKASNNPVTDIIGEYVIISGDISPGSIGKGTLRGSSWQVHNQSGSPLLKDSRYQVSSIDSLTLIVSSK
ncbi:MAG TPA: NfeD family protein [Oligoflexia bacterium]|mgnify:CR=1 FL=1|nr:NfeD family protein [Oligoflexia bacterium]HMP47907.1 NfeD family protein [Oligoflexia bacterium]